MLIAPFLSSCTADTGQASPATPLPTPRPRLFPQSTDAPRVVVLALPGVQPATVTDLRTRPPSPLPTVNRLLERGRQSALTPVQPPLSAPGLASLATGTLPAEHGALSGALDVGVLGERTIWQLAEEAGKTTAVIGWPHATDPPQPSVWVAQTGRYAAAARHEIALEPLGNASWSEAPTSLTPPAEGHLPLRRAGREVGAVQVLALDTRDDGDAAYDTFLLDVDRTVGPETARLTLDGPDRWASLRVVEDAGADFKLLEVTENRLVLYQSEAPHYTAVPADLQDAVDAQLGFYPPPADYAAYAAGWLTSEDLLRMAARQTNWLAHVSALVWRAYHPDLLAANLPVVAQVTPPTLLVDPAQPGWQPQRENDLADVRRRAYAAADDALATFVPHVDLSRTTIVAASPHGYSPVHTEIDLVALLQEWELVTIASDGTPNWAEASVRVTVEDGIAWLWPAPGVESRDEFRAAQRAAFEAVTDPLNGQSPVARILSGDALSEAALWTQATRDALFVQLKPGYRFVLRDGETAFAHTTRFGAAGYTPDEPSMQGWLLATGWRVRPSKDDGRDTRVVDVAATAARLLDLPWPLRHGRPLDEWLDLP